MIFASIVGWALCGIITFVLMFKFWGNKMHVDDWGFGLLVCVIFGPLATACFILMGVGNWIITMKCMRPWR